MSSRMAKTVAALRSEVGNSEVSEWPTCLLCTELSELRHPGLGRNWVPVEGYRIEPDTVFQAHTLVGERPTIWDSALGRSVPQGPKSITILGPMFKARQLTDKGWFRIIAECHGHEAVAEIDVPFWWGMHKVKAAIQSLMFFGPEKKLRIA